MKQNDSEMPNGYLETIEKGIAGIRTFRSGMTQRTGTRQKNLEKLKREIETADAVVIGAGAGLSTSAGFIYTGERFEKWFQDFIREYGIRDMYSGGFYPYPAKEIFWAYWARYIYINRYLDPPKPVYQNLMSLVKDKDYFVVTTNVDHCFQKAGVDRERLFYTQGDYGLFQSTDAENHKTYQNETWVMQAMEAQGFCKNEEGIYVIPKNGRISTEIPAEMVPRCPDDGKEMIMNLRSDDNFVEDEGWHKASAAYSDFLREHEGMHILFLEIGVGNNTPVIIKYPFWEMTKENRNAVYACLNYSEACCPTQIEKQSILIDGDSGDVIKKILQA